MGLDQDAIRRMVQSHTAGVEEVRIHRADYDPKITVHYANDSTFNLMELDEKMREMGYALDGISFRHRTVSWKKEGDLMGMF